MGGKSSKKRAKLTRLAELDVLLREATQNKGGKKCEKLVQERDKLVRKRV